MAIDNPNEWMVVSQESGETKTYNVTFLQGFENCSCLLKCKECNECMKSVRCECVDFCVRSNFCKHIHYVAMRKERTHTILEPVLDDEGGLNIMIDETSEFQRE